MNTYTNTSIFFRIFVCILYNSTNKYNYMCSSTNNFDFSKIILDTDLKFSGFTKLLTTYRMVYHLYM